MLQLKFDRKFSIIKSNLGLKQDMKIIGMYFRIFQVDKKEIMLSQKTLKLKFVH